MMEWLAEEKAHRHRRQQSKLAAAMLTMQLKERRRELGWRSPSEYRMRWMLAWAFNVGLILLACLVSVVYALKFQEAATRNMVLTWLVAYGVTFLVVEPIQICLLGCTPCCFDENTRFGRVMSKIRFWYNELCAP